MTSFTLSSNMNLVFISICNTMKLTSPIVVLVAIQVVLCHIQYLQPQNDSQVALALSEIINGLQPFSLTILALNNSLSDDIDKFIYKIHKLCIKSCIFFHLEEYFDFVQDTISGSVQSTSLIFFESVALAKEIHDRNLTHRLSLFIFYWGAERPPKSSSLRFEEPMRAVVITRPRKTAFRVYYNQAVPDGRSNLHLVNWYDQESLGLFRTPLLPDSSTVYSNFGGRMFFVPVIHSPPWHFIRYYNDTSNATTNGTAVKGERKFDVLGGRDHYLLKLIATKMNFKFTYLDPQQRTQGTSFGPERKSLFTGALGMIQNREAHFLFGDVGLSWERRKAAEFSFFTLVDSGAFATHAPRRLNEALAILRPFKMNVWPYLIITVLLSGPIIYFIIVIPTFWKSDESKPQTTPSIVYHPEYLNEITLVKTGQPLKNVVPTENRLPENLLDKCVWFTLQLFLKQSCSAPYGGMRTRFLVIVYWIAATYVLADVYSAHLTSQFARPAREAPIDTLTKLEEAMRYRGYQLYVEKGSSMLEMLENSTEIFRRIYNLMQSHSINPLKGQECFLINSVEEGIQSILFGAERAILGGRETLYFNIKRYGINHFHLSQQLYTRYSAVAVQIGCPFLDSFNDVLIHLFESGILDKITSSEYEKMSAANKAKTKYNKFFQKDGKPRIPFNFELNIQPINLRMLQGAFHILLAGYLCAGLVLGFEVIVHWKEFDIVNFGSEVFKPAFKKVSKWINVLIRHIKRLSLKAIYYVISKN